MLVGSVCVFLCLSVCLDVCGPHISASVHHSNFIFTGLIDMGGGNRTNSSSFTGVKGQGHSVQICVDSTFLVGAANLKNESTYQHHIYRIYSLGGSLVRKCFWLTFVKGQGHSGPSKCTPWAEIRYFRRFFIYLYTNEHDHIK